MITRGSNAPIVFKPKNAPTAAITKLTAILTLSSVILKQWALEDVSYVEGSYHLPLTEAETLDFKTGMATLEIKFLVSENIYFTENKVIQIKNTDNVEPFGVAVAGNQEVEPISIEVTTNTVYVGGGGGGGAVNTVNNKQPDITGNVSLYANDIDFTDGQNFQEKFDSGQLKGEKGDTGAKGDTGLKGDKGDTGEQGLPGEQGVKGDPGQQGEQGLKGDKGEQGNPGTNGTDGENATINGVNTLNMVEGANITLSQQGSTLTISASGGGSGGEDGATFTPMPTVTANTLNLAWTNDKGKPNPTPVDITAPKGDTGAKGDKGDPGENGAKGDKGDTGEQGLKGDKGDIGEQGLKGDTGSPGQNATINGVNTLTISEGANITITQTGNDLSIAATGGGSSIEVVQSTGQSTTAVMSQKAVTDALATAITGALEASY